MGFSSPKIPFFHISSSLCLSPLTLKTRLGCSFFHQVIECKLHTFELWTIYQLPENSSAFQIKLNENDQFVQGLTRKLFLILAPHFVDKTTQTKTEMFSIQILRINVAPPNLENFDHIGPQPVLSPQFKQTHGPVNFSIHVCRESLFGQFFQGTFLHQLLESKFFLLHWFHLVSHHLVTTKICTKVKHSSISISWGTVLIIFRISTAFIVYQQNVRGVGCEVDHVDYPGRISTGWTLLGTAYTCRTLLGNAERCLVACCLVQHLSWHPFWPSNTFKFGNQNFFFSKPIWRRFCPFNIREFTLTIATPHSKLRLWTSRTRLRTVLGQGLTTKN